MYFICPFGHIPCLFHLPTPRWVRLVGNTHWQRSGGISAVSSPPAGKPWVGCLPAPKAPSGSSLHLLPSPVLASVPSPASLVPGEITTPTVASQHATPLFDGGGSADFFSVKGQIINLLSIKKVGSLLQDSVHPLHFKSS